MRQFQFSILLLSLAFLVSCEEKVADKTPTPPTSPTVVQENPTHGMEVVASKPYYICYNNDSKPDMALSIYFDGEGIAQEVRYKGQTESIDLKFEKEEYIEGGAHPTIIENYTEMYEGKPNGTYKLAHSGVWDYAEYKGLKSDKTFKFTIDHELAIVDGAYRESPCY